MTTYIFLPCAIVGVIFCYYLKYRFSGQNYKTPAAVAIMFTNAVLVFSYIELTQNECILFYECFPGLVENHSAVEWVAVACIFLHCFAIPTQWEPWRLFRFRRKL